MRIRPNNPPTAPQRYLVLMVLPADLTMGGTVDALASSLEDKLGGRANSANSFWSEASYNKISFSFDIPRNVIRLTQQMAHYYQWPKPNVIDASGATYPITWVGNQNLDLLGDDNFRVSVTFSGSNQAIDDIVRTINNQVNSQHTGSGPRPIIAGENRTTHQLALATGRNDPAAALEIVGGNAVSLLGLTVGTRGAGGRVGVDNLSSLTRDSLNNHMDGRTDQFARTYLSQFGGLIVAVVGAVTTPPYDILRAHAETNPQSFNVNTQPSVQYECHWLAIDNQHDWTVFTHEIGHNIGFADLYGERIPLIGDEPRGWDMMHSNTDAHPVAWNKHWETRNRGLMNANVDPTPGSMEVDPTVDFSWMPPSEITTIGPPRANTTQTTEVLLAPSETPLPTTNPFSTRYPNIPFSHAIRIKVEPNVRSLYVENRRRGPYNSPFGNALYSGHIPDSGIIVTDALFRYPASEDRGWVTMKTPLNSTLKMLNDELEVETLTATSHIRVRIAEVINDSATGPDATVYKVAVIWGEDPFYDALIHDWQAQLPIYESRDIWVDTQVYNNWDEYVHSDRGLERDILGNPVLNGDTLRVNWPARLYARVWNSGEIPMHNVRVIFEKIVPAGMGPLAREIIGTDTIILPGRHPDGSPSYAIAKTEWTPRSANEGHVCIRVTVVHQRGEQNADNNTAQENFTDWYLRGSSPYEPVTFPFKVANPLPHRASIRLQASGLRPGWFMDVDPVEFWLEPEETIEGTAVIRADSSVPFEKEGDPSLIITLEAEVQKGDTFVPFGGISGTAHPVRKTKIDNINIKSQNHGVIVSGIALTADSSVVDANVSLRLLQSDGNTEVEIYQTRTNVDGLFTQEIKASKNISLDEFYYLEAVLSPTIGTGPADMAPIKFTFKSDR